MQLVDSHCHLNFPDFQKDIDEVIAQAGVRGVGTLQTICTDMEEFEELISITSRYKNVFCSVGVHPNDSGKTRQVSADELIEKTRHPKVIGIGETGLDYHYETSDRATQQESFRTHIAAAQATGLPLIIHTREAEADTYAMLREAMEHKPFKGVLHCFTSSAQLAEQCLNLGLYISFSGILTFKNATDLKAVAKTVPADRILIETDAPYLAPVPYRGKRNEPAYVAEVNACLAELRGIPAEECAALTTANFFRLFAKATPA